MQASSSSTEAVVESTVGGALRDAAAAAPHSVALTFAAHDQDRRELTFGELLEESERAGAALLGRFEPGEHVAVWAPNMLEWVLLMYGAALAGLVLVPVNPALQPRELLHVVGQSRSRGVFTVPSYRGRSLLEALDSVRQELPLVREVVDLTEWDRFVAGIGADVRLPAVGPDDITQIQYTSGTTGRPRGAMLTHRGFTNASRFVALAAGTVASDVWLNPNPLFHASGAGFMNLGPLQLLCRQVLCPFDAGLVLALIEAERPAILGAAATMVRMVLDHPDLASRDLSSLRAVALGGMPVAPDLVREAESALGATLLIGYGQTEASGLTHLVRPDDPLEVRTGTVGRALPNVEVRVADPKTGETLPPGETGEIQLRGYQVMAGFFLLPEATAEAIDGHGWLDTGDVGCVDAGGQLRIAGRTREMIIRGGENIFPAEIEAVVSRHPGVAAVAVLGVPDPMYGELVAAVVQRAPGAAVDEPELVAFCLAELAAFKVPVRWEFVAEMPRTPIGEIQKFVLRERMAGL